MSDVKPVRLQLSRRKGFDLQKLSLETNGLPAVNCARPSKWGNPFRVGSVVPVEEGEFGGPQIGTTKIASTQEAVEAYREWMYCFFEDEDRQVLKGKNLACWCAPGAPCHADVLLELSNQPPSGSDNREKVA